MLQPRALVIDDSRVARAMVTRALAGLYEISQADCAEAALETLDTLAGSDPFALVVVDWNMPGMTGVEFVRQLRMSDSYADVKILMITTEVETQGVITALEAGVDEYLMKPFSRAAVLEKLALLGLPCDEFGTTSVD
ncbi:MAG TPA: response regulator [Mycobacterium sp.]|nr:response regulator [Mycobacterium sp.]